MRRDLSLYVDALKKRAASHAEEHVRQERERVQTRLNLYYTNVISEMLGKFGPEGSFSTIADLSRDGGLHTHHEQEQSQARDQSGEQSQSREREQGNAHASKGHSRRRVEESLNHDHTERPKTHTLEEEQKLT